MVSLLYGWRLYSCRVRCGLAACGFVIGRFAGDVVAWSTLIVLFLVGLLLVVLVFV